MASLTNHYFHSASSLPFLTLRLGDLADFAEKQWANKEAVHFPFQNVTKTFKGIKEDVDKVAVGLSELKLEKQERVAYFSLNCYESYVFLLAAWKVGLVVVMVNPALQREELKYMLEFTEATAVLVGKSTVKHDLFKVVADTLDSINVTGKGRPHVITTEDDGRCQFSVQKWLDSKQPVSPLANGQHSFDDISTIIFTSGTTGKPKAVTISHHSFVNNGYFAANKLQISSNAKICNTVQMFHGFGTQFGLIIPLLTGSTVLFPSHDYKPFEIQKALEATSTPNCNILAGSPTILYDIAQAGGNTGIKQLIFSGSACTPEHLAAFKTAFPAATLICLYGISEAGFIFVDGHVLDHVEVKLSESGELFVRSYGVTKGYLKNPVPVIDAFSWFRTGDICRLGEKDKWEVIGRATDQINRGGVKVNPREVEDLLYQMKEIEEAHVFGVKNPRLGQEVGAWIKLKEGGLIGEEEIKGFCKGRIAHFKVPTCIRITTEFPRTSIGKVKKNVMAEKMQELIGRVEDKDL